MQAIKDKLHDLAEMRQAKASAREEEREEKELAKTRVAVAKEVRQAKEAEAAMDLHVNRAAEKVAKQEAKHEHEHHRSAGTGNNTSPQLPTDLLVDSDHAKSRGGAGGLGLSSS